MKHLTEEELIDHYYGEAASPARISSHLQECRTCADAYAALRQDLASINLSAVPARDARYGEQVWQSIRTSLPVYEKQKRSWLNLNIRKSLSYATVCALLVAIAFFAGRQWEHRRPQPTQLAGNNQPQRPIVLVVMGDHLDRSERLLIELNHADTAGVASPVKAEASDLLSANRLYRESATQGW